MFALSINHTCIDYTLIQFAFLRHISYITSMYQWKKKNEIVCQDDLFDTYIFTYKQNKALHIMISLMVLKLPPDLLCSPFFCKQKKENATLKICSDRLTYLLQCILMKQYDLIYTGPDLVAKWFSKFEWNDFELPIQYIVERSFWRRRRKKK